MNHRRLWTVLLTSILLIAGGGVAAFAATSATASATPPEYCVTFGHGGLTSAGNWVQYNWHHNPTCPAGTYAHTTADPDPAATPAPSASAPADNDAGLLGNVFQVGHTGADAAQNTSFTIVDNSVSPAVKYTCQLTLTANPTPVAGISCVKAAA